MATNDPSERKVCRMLVCKFKNGWWAIRTETPLASEDWTSGYVLAGDLLRLKEDAHAELMPFGRELLRGIQGIANVQLARFTEWQAEVFGPDSADDFMRVIEEAARAYGTPGSRTAYFDTYLRELGLYDSLPEIISVTEFYDGQPHPKGIIKNPTSA